MEIDEKKDIFDLSDHNLIEVKVRIGKQNNRFKESYINKSYISLKEEDKYNFIEKLQNDLKNSEVKIILRY